MRLLIIISNRCVILKIHMAKFHRKYMLHVVSQNLQKFDLRSQKFLENLSPELSNNFKT